MCRTRDEVQGVRRARDTIEHVRKILVDRKIAAPDQLKKLEKSLKKEASQPRRPSPILSSPGSMLQNSHQLQTLKNLV